MKWPETASRPRLNSILCRVLLFLLVLGSTPARAGVSDFVLPWPEPSPTNDAGKLYTIGLDMVSQEKWTAARAFFEQIVRLQPQQKEALHMAGLCLWQEGQFPRSERYLALASRHPQPEAVTFLALAAINAGATNLLEGAGWLRKALRELDEAGRVWWIAHPSLEPLWTNYDPAFRSVLAEFNLPRTRDEAVSEAAKLPPPRPSATGAAAAATDDVYRTDVLLHPRAATAPEAAPTPADSVATSNASPDIAVPAEPELPTSLTPAPTNGIAPGE